MSWLIFEALLALAVIVGIMVWTLKTRSDTPLTDDTTPPPDADTSDQPPRGDGRQ